MLNRLECVATSTFTAEYTILTRLGDIDSSAEVVQASAGRRSITINDVRYVYDNGRTATCDLVSETCEAIINEARTSDILLTSEFYAQAMASRFRVDADRRIGDPVASEEQIGGQAALCVDVPVTGGTKTYCALESGALARFDANDLLIELDRVLTDARRSRLRHLSRTVSRRRQPLGPLTATDAVGSEAALSTECLALDSSACELRRLDRT